MLKFCQLTKFQYAPANLRIDKYALDFLLQFDPSKDYTMFGKISYDETNTRVRIIEEDRTGGQRDYYDTLFLHNVVSISLLVLFFFFFFFHPINLRSVELIYEGRK